MKYTRNIQEIYEIYGIYNKYKNIQYIQECLDHIYLWMKLCMNIIN